MGLPGPQGDQGSKGQHVSPTSWQNHKLCYSSLRTTSSLQKTHSSFWNKTLILIFDLGWHRGARLSRDTRNVWTEGEFYHTLPGIWFKCFFLVKNRNVIVNVCLPNRNKQRWDLSFLKEFFPLGNMFSSTRSKSVIIHTSTEVYFCWGFLWNPKPWAYKTGQACVVVVFLCHS